MDISKLEDLGLGEMSRAEYELFKKQLDFQYRRLQPKDQEYNPRMQPEMVYEAYKRVLEGMTVDEAFAVLAEICNTTEEFVQKAKNNRYLGRNGAKRVVQMGDTLQEQKEMKAKKTFDPKGIKRTNTPNSTLRKLHRDFAFHQRLKNLEDQVEQLGLKDEALEAEISKLKGEVAIQDHEIGVLYETIGLSGFKDKEKAKILKSRGLTQQQIADTVGKSVRTIKRWWTEFEQEEES